MFFMGEEIGAQKSYTWDKFMENREDLFGDRDGTGANLYRYYQDAIRFSRRHPAVRALAIDIIHVNDDARVIAFTRFAGSDQLLVIASLNNSAFPEYVVQTDAWRLPDGAWREIFNSDAALYGGSNTGNAGAGLPATNGCIQIVLPANGFVVFEKD
jgi:1,4-alpha-glucan branching enzyme